MLHTHWLNFVTHASFVKLLSIPNGPQPWYVCLLSNSVAMYDIIAASLICQSSLLKLLSVLSI